MADYSPSQNTKGAAVLTPRKGQLKSFFDFFGGKTLRLNNDLGAMAIFFFRSFFMIFRIKQIPEIIAQVFFIGAKSTQIVLLIGFFTGMVLGLQLYFVLVKFGSVGVQLLKISTVNYPIKSLQIFQLNYLRILPSVSALRLR